MGVRSSSGFSGGQLPPKNTIREVRINQNPFSPEFDKLGYGRIEIFTKPGSDRFHADLGYNFATDKWNSRNPYAAEKAPFLLNEFREMVSGPLGKRASFNVTVMREVVNNGNVVNAVVLDPQTLAITPFTATPVAELRRTGVTPRVDYQLNPNNTLSVRYSYNRDIVRDTGTGGFNLESRGYHNDALAQTLQVTETAVLSTSVINETRFQYFRPTTVAKRICPDTRFRFLGRSTTAAILSAVPPILKTISRSRTTPPFFAAHMHSDSVSGSARRMKPISRHRTMEGPLPSPEVWGLNWTRIISRFSTRVASRCS